MKRLARWPVLVVAALCCSSVAGAQVTSDGNEVLSQRGPLAGTSEAGDLFGAALASGDFDGDGFADAAIAVPLEGLRGADRAGLVQVVYGSASGLDADRAAAFTQRGAVGGTPEENDQFGTQLVAADFDGDGYADLAIGVPGESLGDVVGAGIVQILFGGPSGLAESGSQTLSQVGLVAGGAEPGDRFGAVLGAGDFNGDGYADLVVGAPGEGIGSIRLAGVVHVLYGSAAGVTTDGRQVFHDPDGPTEFVGFPLSAGAGDFDADGFDDLALGNDCFLEATELFGASRATTAVAGCEAGVVHVLSGGSGGLTTLGRQRFTQTGALIGVGEELDQFGRSLAVGDFDGDARADLAVGVPGESLADIVRAGRVAILYGTADGLSPERNASVSQRGALSGKAEAGDQFGSALTAGDFDGDGTDDLVIGVPEEDLGLENTGAGMVHVLAGSPVGVTTDDDQLFTQRDPVAQRPEPGDGFGWSVITGDFNGDEIDDLLVGAPFEDLAGRPDAGVVHVLYGQLG